MPYVIKDKVDGAYDVEFYEDRLDIPFGHVEVTDGYYVKKGRENEFGFETLVQKIERYNRETREKEGKPVKKRKRRTKAEIAHAEMLKRKGIDPKTGEPYKRRTKAQMAEIRDKGWNPKTGKPYQRKRRKKPE